MGKRTNSDLRTNPVQMSVHKYSDINLLRAGAKQYWNIENIQPFFPSIEKLFKTDELESATDYGIRFKDEVARIQSTGSIRTVGGQVVPIHNKVSMVLSPFKWMRGEYGRTLGLPSLMDEAKLLHHKLQSPHNSSYVGSIISSIVSESDCIHFPKVYGVFTGISNSHTIDISDDYEELSTRHWFSSNIGKTFDIEISDKVQSNVEFKHTRKARLGLHLGDEVSLDGVEELEVPTCEDVQMAETSALFQEDEDMENASDSSSVSTSYIFGVKSCNCDDDEEDEVTVDEELEEDPFAWATFEHVPVQVTVMEQCEGTIYSLLMKHPEQEKRLSWISQVIFALAFAQRNFGFVHNDLHANNIMYVPTDKEFMYYNVAGTNYRLPTYGYLIKLIDFERSIVSVRVAGMKEPKLFMSDHYSLNEEAAGQYNFEPFYYSKYETVKPNSSFDLVRFATSMFWDLFPEGPEYETYSQDPIFQMFIRWMKTEDGSSVLFGKVEPTHDRYHGFHLYKAIARFCKNAVPRKEIQLLKSRYGITSIPKEESICTIEA